MAAAQSVGKQVWCSTMFFFNLPSSSSLSSHTGRYSTGTDPCYLCLSPELSRPKWPQRGGVWRCMMYRLYGRCMLYGLYGLYRAGTGAVWCCMGCMGCIGLQGSGTGRACCIMYIYSTRDFDLATMVGVGLLGRWKCEVHLYASGSVPRCVLGV